METLRVDQAIRVPVPPRHHIHVHPLQIREGDEAEVEADKLGNPNLGFSNVNCSINRTRQSPTLLTFKDKRGTSARQDRLASSLYGLHEARTGPGEEGLVSLAEEDIHLIEPISLLKHFLLLDSGSDTRHLSFSDARQATQSERRSLLLRRTDSGSFVVDKSSLSLLAIRVEYLKQHLWPLPLRESTLQSGRKYSDSTVGTYLGQIFCINNSTTPITIVHQ